MQVAGHNIGPRCDHCATSFSLGPGKIEVTIFGGCLSWPETMKTLDDVPILADTMILRFGEKMFCNQ